MEEINRIKVVLVEKKKTSRWLAAQLNVTPSTVSKWCTNSSQPDIATVLKISDLLEVDIKELIVREYKKLLQAGLIKKRVGKKETIFGLEKGDNYRYTEVFF